MNSKYAEDERASKRKRAFGVADQEILLELEKERQLVFTPSRLAGGRRLVCYDDRYILKLAAETDGIVVSNDNYRDLAAENPEFKKVVIERLLMYSFVNDRSVSAHVRVSSPGSTSYGSEKNLIFLISKTSISEDSLVLKL